MWIIVTRIVVNSGLSIVLEKQVGARSFVFCVSYFSSFHLLPSPIRRCVVLYSAWRFGVFPPPLFF